MPLYYSINNTINIKIYTCFQTFPKGFVGFVHKMYVNGNTFLFHKGTKKDHKPKVTLCCRYRVTKIIPNGCSYGHCRPFDGKAKPCSKYARLQVHFEMANFDMDHTVVGNAYSIYYMFTLRTFYRLRM